MSWGWVATASSYVLQENANGGGWGTVQSNSATSWGASGRGTGSYAYRAQGCNTGGCGPWSSSGTVAVTVTPAVPTSLALSQTGTSSKPVIKATWGAVSGATSYQLEETHPQNGVSVVYNGTATTWSSLIFATGIVKFRVRACNGAGCSAYGPYQSVMLNSGGNLPMEQPANDEGEADQEKAP